MKIQAKTVFSSQGKVTAIASRIREIRSDGNCVLTNVDSNIYALSTHGSLTIKSDGRNKTPFGYLSASNGIFIAKVQTQSYQKPSPGYSNLTAPSHSGEVICTNGPIIAEDCNLLAVQCAGQIKLTNTRTKELTFYVGTVGTIELNNSEINGNVTIKKVDLAADNSFILYRKKRVEKADSAKNDGTPQKTEEEKAAEEALEEALNREAEQFEDGAQGLIDGQPYEVKKRKFVPLANYPKDAVKVVVTGTGGINGNIIFYHCRGILIPNKLVRGKVEEVQKPKASIPPSQPTTVVNTSVNLSYRNQG